MSQRGRCEIERSTVVEELHVQLLLRLRDSTELIDEIHVPRAATELTVGRRLQADLALHRNGVAYRRVLDLAQRRCGDRARGVLSACLHELGRAQQAADVVGAKGWLSASAHRMCSSTAISAVAYPMTQSLP